jgi:hypothetical protein
MLKRTHSVVGGAAILLAAALLLSPGSAFAAAKGTPMITGYAGNYFGGQIYSGYSGTVGDVEAGDGFVWGLQVAYVFNKVIGLEFTYGNNSEDLRFSSPYAVQSSKFGTADENRYEFDINFYTNPNKVVGYFCLGAGWTDYSATIDTDDATDAFPASQSTSEFTTNIGLGALIYMKPNLALRVDGRWRYTDTNINSSYVYCDIYGYCYTYDDSYYGSGTLTGGITYVFGKK